MKDSARRSSAALVMAGSSILFALMAVSAKRVSTRLPGAEIAFVRFLVGIVATAIAATRVRLRARNWRGLFLRGAFGGAAVLCYFAAIEHLTVGVATLLNYCAPVFTALWAALFLSEPLGLAALGALALTTGGVALVIYAGAPPGTLGFGPWQLVGVLAAVLSGAAIATIREVRKTDGPWEIFVSFCLIGAVITGVPSARHWVRPDAREWGWLLAVGVLSVVAQLLMTWALRWLRAAVAGILMQLTPVASLIIGWLWFGETIRGLAMIGVGVTLAGVSWGARIASTPEVPSEEP
jgi:drug/metabolite transporter (DMT)-like permease